MGADIPSGDASFDPLLLEKCIDPDTETKVISSTQMNDWENVSPVKQFPNRISKKVIPADFSRYKMSIVTKVEPGVSVGTHTHEEPIFRYVVEGDVTINGIKHGPGDWVLVPSKVPYNVATVNGYTVFAKYGVQCGTPHDRNVVLDRRD